MNAQRIIAVTGSREWTDPAPVHFELAAQLCFGRIRIVHGDCRGLDHIARDWALARFLDTAPYPADWNLGPSAGPRRNRWMLDDARPDLLIAFPLPDSRGTWDCIRAAIERGIRVLIPSQRR